MITGHEIHEYLGLNSKHDNLFSSNAFWKIELRRSLLETKTQFDVKVST